MTVIKRTIIFIAISMFIGIGVMAQPTRVIPNKPYSSLSSNPGYITINEFTRPRMRLSE